MRSRISQYIEVEAAKRVCHLFEGLGWRVQAHPRNHKGSDLLATRETRRVEIEVKGRGWGLFPQFPDYQPTARQLKDGTRTFHVSVPQVAGAQLIAFVLVQDQPSWRWELLVTPHEAYGIATSRGRQAWRYKPRISLPVKDIKARTARFLIEGRAFGPAEVGDFQGLTRVLQVLGVR